MGDKYADIGDTPQVGTLFDDPAYFDRQVQRQQQARATARQQAQLPPLEAQGPMQVTPASYSCQGEANGGFSYAGAADEAIPDAAGRRRRKKRSNKPGEHGENGANGALYASAEEPHSWLQDTFSGLTTGIGASLEPEKSLTTGIYPDSQMRPTRFGREDSVPFPEHATPQNKPTFLSGNSSQDSAGSDNRMRHTRLSLSRSRSPSKAEHNVPIRAQPLVRLMRPSRSGGGEESPCAYGALRFPSTMGQRDSNRVKPAKWAAVGPNSDLHDVCGLLTTTWGLPWPDVIISVTGAAKLPDLSEEKTEVIELGLLESIRASKAWVVTGGTDGGVMQLAGRTMARQAQGEQYVCLGVASWGIVKDFEVLERRAKKIHSYNPGLVGSSLSERSVREVSRGRRQRPPRGPRAELEPNHSHFIFVDAGPEAEGQFGKEIELRAAMEDALCTFADEVEDKAASTAMVLLVVAGGIGTLSTVLNVLDKRRPVVVVLDSGGAAKDIHEFCVNGNLPTNELPKSDKGHAGRQDAVDKSPELLPKIKEFGEQLVGVTGAPLLTFVDTTKGATSFTVDLLEAILSMCPSAVDALMHAISWGHPEILRKELSSKWTSLSRDNLAFALETALITATKQRDERSLKCATILMDAAVTTEGIGFNALCLSTSSRLTTVSIEYIENKLKERLNIESLLELEPEHMLEDSDSQFRVESRSKHRKKSLVSRFSRVVRQPAMKVGEPPLREGGHNTLGFFLLEQMCSVCGFVTHLRARSELGGIHREPCFTDLMMWSVLMGHFELSRELWRRSNYPLRSAVMARRLCLSLIDRGSGNDHSDSLTKAADMFEDWAVGTLEQIQTSEEAFDILTCTPMRPNPDRELRRPGSHLAWIHLWPGSTLDQAMSNEYPCRQFISHAHCQRLLADYLSGNYRSSPTAVPADTSVSRLWVQAIIHLLNVPFCGMLPNVCELDVPQFSQLSEEDPRSAAHDEDDLGEDEEFDEDYFEDNQKSRRRSRRGYGSAQMFWGFWSIPLVNFTMHATMNFMCISLQMSNLFIQSRWRQTEGTSFTSEELRKMIVHYGQSEFPLRLTVEVAFWTMYVGLVFEEGRQLYSGGFDLKEYWSRFFNKIDVLLFCCLGPAFALRVYMVFHGGAGAVNSEVVFFQFDLMLIGFVLQFIRTFEILIYHPKMGEVWLILLEMIAETVPELIFMLLLATCVGLVFFASYPYWAATQFMPPGWDQNGTHSLPVEFAAHPVFAGLWAMIGEYAFNDNMLAVSPAEPGFFNWLPVLLYIEAFLTTIFLVNLMIAKMTAKYDQIRSQSLAYRAHQKFHFTLEFKDERGSPTPFNLASLLLCWMPSSWKGRIWGKKARARGFAVGMGREATLRVQQREKRFTHSYVEQSVRTDEKHTDARVAAIHDNMPLLHNVSRRSEALEAEMNRMHGKISTIRKLEQKVDHLIEVQSKLSQIGGFGGGPQFGGMLGGGYDLGWDGRIQIETRDPPAAPRPAVDPYGPRSRPAVARPRGVGDRSTFSRGGAVEPDRGAKRTFVSTIASTFGLG